MELAIDQGAEDVITDDEGGIEIICAPADFSKLKQALEAAGFKAEIAEIIMKPENEIAMAGDEGERMQKLLDALESLDDVQEIFSSAVISE